MYLACYPINCPFESNINPCGILCNKYNYIMQNIVLSGPLFLFVRIHECYGSTLSMKLGSLFLVLRPVVF